MSDIDLTAAIKAGENAYRAACFNGVLGQECRAELVRTAAPLIESQVREQVAREIEIEAARDDITRILVRSPGDKDHWDGVIAGKVRAARIARGGAR